MTEKADAFLFSYDEAYWYRVTLHWAAVASIPVLVYVVIQLVRAVVYLHHTPGSDHTSQAWLRELRRREANEEGEE